MRSRSSVPALVVLVALLLVACGGTSEQIPSSKVVTIVGPVGLLVGTSVQLTAVTIDGSDPAYDWVSDDPAYASVDETGWVTGVAPGTATIRATGVVTQASDTVEVKVSAWEEVDVTLLPYYAEWKGSAHGDETAAAFHHWDEGGEIPTTCARCHSSPGFIDFLGDDGSAAGTVDKPAPSGTVVDCAACHSSSAAGLEDVTFASGDRITDVGRQALCMQCHQTRGSTPDVDAAIADAGAASDDTVSSTLGLENPHYLGAGATRFGTRARGGYQYEGLRYDARFFHVDGMATCLDCHDPHSLEIEPAACATCHEGVETIQDTRAIRMASSAASDYDGDGDRAEGVYDEIQGLDERLLAAILAYADDVVGDAIAFDEHTYPYFFRDTNGNGTAEADEAVYANAYASWTPRLVRAAYNLLFARKDPGGYAHNAKYVIQVLHDSLADVNGALPAPADLAALVRDDPGHFDGASEAARHWDASKTITGACLDCHGESPGYLAALGEGPAVDSRPPPNGLDCAVCHEDFVDFTLRDVTETTFPGGTTLVYGEDTTSFPQDAQSFLCFGCHKGREAKATIDDAITDGSLRLPNVHRGPAAGVLFGTATAVGYEYDGQLYAGRWSHTSMANCSTCHSRPHTWFHVPDPVDWWDHSSGPNGSQCVVCHGAEGTDHTFRAEDRLEMCQKCHFTYDAVNDVLVPPATPRDIRVSHTADYDGDGDTTESLADEIATLAGDLLARIQTVADTAGDPIAYDADTYPYFFRDTNGNGVVDGDEGAYGNAYDAWTSALMKAAQNFQISQQDPGAWVHNFSYTAQLLIDAIADLGGAVDGYVRPN